MSCFWFEDGGGGGGDASSSLLVFRVTSGSFVGQASFPLVSFGSFCCCEEGIVVLLFLFLLVLRPSPLSLKGLRFRTCRLAVLSSVVQDLLQRLDGSTTIAGTPPTTATTRPRRHVHQGWGVRQRRNRR